MLKIKTEGGVTIGTAKTTREGAAKAKAMLKDAPHMSLIEVVDAKGKVKQQVWRD